MLYSVPKLANYGQTAAAAVWASNTFAQGTSCSAVVASAGGGSLGIQNSAGTHVFTAPALNGRH